jgi:hypothetical protein
MARDGERAEVIMALNMRHWLLWSVLGSSPRCEIETIGNKPNRIQLKKLAGLLRVYNGPKKITINIKFNNFASLMSPQIPPVAPCERWAHLSLSHGRIEMDSNPEGFEMYENSRLALRVQGTTKITFKIHTHKEHHQRTHTRKRPLPWFGAPKLKKNFWPHYCTWESRQTIRHEFRISIELGWFSWPQLEFGPLFATTSSIQNWVKYQIWP